MIAPLLLLVISAAGAQAQTQQSSQTTTTSIPVSSPETVKAFAPPPVISTTEKDSSDSTDNSLKTLLSLYESEAAKHAAKNQQLRELYTDGLIARIELEESDKAVQDARARVEETQQQIVAQIAKAAVAPEPEISSTSWTTGSQKIDDLIRAESKLNDVDPYLIYCVISQESSFRSSAVSPKGAQGLMQLMPGTAARYGVVNPFDPVQNIKGGTRYLRDLLDLFDGRVDLALAGYNAGEGTVIKYGKRVPPYAETQSYVRLISMRYMKKKNGNL